MNAERSFFDDLDAAGATTCIAVRDAASQLRAFIVLDDLTLGPAAGGIRTWRYRSERDALRDAAALAAAMTVKCALAGLPAGGGKAVVMDHEGFRRPEGFFRLGRAIADLGGRFVTAGDLGTGHADLAAVARATRHVCTDESHLAAAVARGLRHCLEAAAAVRGRTVSGLAVAVQGCGAIGRAVIHELATAGASLVVADIDAARAEAVARQVGARTCPADDVLVQAVDVVAPCAIGGVITEAVARDLRAWAVCGAANNALAGPEAAAILLARDILHVPDPIASAGAVIAGLATVLPGVPPADSLIARLGTTTREVLEESRRSSVPPSAVALARARSLLAHARGEAPA